MKNLSLWLLLLCSLHHYAGAEACNFSKDSLPAKKECKNSIGLEIIGNPLSLYYERQVFSTGKYSLHVMAGINPLTLAGFGFPGLSFGATHKFKLKRSFAFFVMNKFEFLSISAPNYAFTPERIPQGLSFNVLSANAGVGISIRKRRWEFAPLYPSVITSLSLYHNGEDQSWTMYPLIALNSRIAYRF